MVRGFLNAKIRDIAITGTYLEYEGSITLDEEYMERAGILPYEEVHVLNVETGARFTTYALKGKRGGGAVELNGPAAHLGKTGERIMVLTYAFLTEKEIRTHQPRVVCIHPQ